MYARILGDSWCQVAEPVRRLHDTRSMTRVHGHVRIEHGRRAVARLLARMCRLPPPHAAAATWLTITTRGDREHWARTFDGHRLDTLQSESASNGRELVERFGPLEFRFRLEPIAEGLVYRQRQAAIVCGRLRMRLPTACAPRVEAREDAVGPEHIQIAVRIVFPVVGLLISYGGIVAIESTQP